MSIFSDLLSADVVSTGTTIIEGAFALAAATITLRKLKGCFHQVKQQNAAIVETFGKYSKTLTPGLSLTWPSPISKIVKVEDLRLRMVPFTATVNTSDNSFVEIPMSLHYRVTNPESAYYQLQDHEKQMVSFAMNEVRSKGANMDMAELFRSSDAIKKTIIAALEQKIGKYGFEIEDVVVATAKPSEEVRAAFNRVIASTKLREAAQNEAEANKVKTVKAAEAEAEAMALYGSGIAKQQIAIAKGAEEAMREMEKSGLSPEQSALVMLVTNGQEATVKAANGNGSVIVSTTSANALTTDASSFLSMFKALGRPAQNPANIEQPAPKVA